MPLVPSAPASSRPPLLGPFAAALSFRAPSSLSAAEREEAWALACTGVHTSRAWLLSQLDHYDEVIPYRDRATGRLVGTTGLRVLDRTVGGRAARILYTGTVTIDPAWRGRGLIPLAGLHTLLRHATIGRRTYWLMETDSWRAYALAAKTLPELWPRPGDAGDPALYDLVCADVFGEDWDPVRRVCRPLAERRLRPELARIPPAVLASNPYARAYAALNPGHEGGDALPVLTRLGLPTLGRLFMAALGRVVGRPRLGAGRAEPRVSVATGAVHTEGA